MMTPTKHSRLFVETHLVRIVALFLIVSALPATHRLVAADLRGQVIATSVTTAQVRLEGSLRPKAGDAVTIYFKMDGLDDEVFVANGKVTRVEGNIASVALEPTEGKVAIGQMARIISADPTTEPSPATSVAAAPPLVSPPSSTAPPRRGKLVLEDSFDSSKDMVMAEGNKNLNGERQLIANPGASQGRYYFSNLPRDFYAQCSVRSASSELSCAVTLAFHALMKGEVALGRHSLLLSPGFVRFASTGDSTGGQWQALPSGIYPDARQSTILGLEVIGSQVRLFINDNCVTSFAIDSPSEGRKFVLSVQSFGQTPCASYFDNLKIYAASSAGQTSGEKKAKTGGEKKAKTGGEKKAKFDTRKR